MAEGESSKRAGSGRKRKRGRKLRKQRLEPGVRNRKPLLEAKCAVKEGFTARHVCLPRRA